MTSNVITLSLNERDQLKQNHVIRELAQRVGSGSRTSLTAATTYYLNQSTGSDSNSGLSSSLAFGTPIGAIAAIAALDFNGYAVTLSVSGNLTTGFSITTPFVGAANSSALTITGDTGTPSNCTITTSGNCVQVDGPGCALAIQGFKLVSTTGDGIFAARFGLINVIGRTDFGACAGHSMRANQLGMIRNTAPSYTISGGGQSHCNANQNGIVINSVTSRTVTLTGTPVFTTGFLIGGRCGTMNAAGNIWSGAATVPAEKRGYAQSNSVIEVGGSFLSLPGNAADVTGFTEVDGGQCI